MRRVRDRPADRPNSMQMEKGTQMLTTHGSRRIRAAALAMLSTGMCAATAFAAQPLATVETFEATPASTVPGPVLTAAGLDGRSLKLHLAQKLGPNAERELQRYRQTVFGESVQVGVSRGSTLAGPTFAGRNPHSSSTFTPSATTGGLGLLNVAWLGLQRIGAQ